MKQIQTNPCDKILSKWTHKTCMHGQYACSFIIHCTCVQVGTQTNSNIQVLVV